MNPLGMSWVCYPFTTEEYSGNRLSIMSEPNETLFSGELTSFSDGTPGGIVVENICIDEDTLGAWMLLQKIESTQYKKKSGTIMLCSWTVTIGCEEAYLYADQNRFGVRQRTLSTTCLSCS